MCIFRLFWAVEHNSLFIKYDFLLFQNMFSFTCHIFLKSVIHFSLEHFFMFLSWLNEILDFFHILRFEEFTPLHESDGVLPLAGNNVLLSGVLDHFGWDFEKFFWKSLHCFVFFNFTQGMYPPHQLIPLGFKHFFFSDSTNEETFKPTTHLLN